MCVRRRVTCTLLLRAFARRALVEHSRQRFYIASHGGEALRRITRGLRQLTSGARPATAALLTAATLAACASAPPAAPYTKKFTGIYSSGAIGFINFALSPEFEPVITIKFLIDDSPSLDSRITKLSQ